MPERGAYPCDGYSQDEQPVAWRHAYEQIAYCQRTEAGSQNERDFAAPHIGNNAGGDVDSGAENGPRGANNADLHVADPQGGFDGRQQEKKRLLVEVLHSMACRQAKHEA